MSSSSALVADVGDLGLQLVRQLALLADGGKDRLAPRIEFAQIGEPLGQQAQLRIVEPARRFLAVARDERNRGALVQQRYGCRHLRRPGADFRCDNRGQAFNLRGVVFLAVHALPV